MHCYAVLLVLLVFDVHGIVIHFLDHEGFLVVGMIAIKGAERLLLSMQGGGNHGDFLGPQHLGLLRVQRGS